MLTFIVLFTDVLAKTSDLCRAQVNNARSLDDMPSLIPLFLVVMRLGRRR